MTKTDAEEELSKIVQRVNETNGTVEYTIQGYAREVVFPWYRRKWKPSTALTTEHRIDHHIMKELGNKTLSWFNRENLQSHPDNLAKRELSQSTLAHVRWDLQLIFNMAVTEGVLPRNPAALLHIPNGVRREKRILNIAEVQAVLASLWACPLA